MKIVATILLWVFGLVVLGVTVLVLAAFSGSELAIYAVFYGGIILGVPIFCISMLCLGVGSGLRSYASNNALEPNSVGGDSGMGRDDCGNPNLATIIGKTGGVRIQPPPLR